MRVPSPRVFAAFAFVAAMCSCASTIGTVRIASPGWNETTVVLEPNSTIRFWSDFDVRYEAGTGDSLGGSIRMYYAIELVQNGVVVGRTTCDALRFDALPAPRICKRKPSWSSDRIVASCVMHDCDLSVPTGGPTIVRAAFQVPNQPATMTVWRANLLISQ
jgi:hypothetical protein